MEHILNVVYASREYKEWGLNASTVGAVGILFFAIVESWGFWKQGRKIWDNHSGESLSFRWFTYLAAYFGASIEYGFVHNSISVSLSSALVGFCHIPIIIGIYKFKKLTWNEKIQSLLFLLMIPALVYTEYKEEFYILLSLGTIYALATQPWELYKTKLPGVVEIRLIGIYILSTIFWIIYAFSIQAVAMMIVCPSALVLLLLTGAFWLRYKRIT